jgi:hypothetical protein
MLTKEQLSEGKIVETYHFKGCTVYVNDAAYVNKTKEELDAIRKEAWRYACELDIQAQLRERGLL